MFPVQISFRATKASISFIRLGVSHCSMTQWVKQKGKERRKKMVVEMEDYEESAEGERRWRSQGQRWKGISCRKEKRRRCNRNERALLLLIIGGVMCQHSLRGFPPEGMIPWGLGHWNHITAPPHAPAHFLCLLMVKEEGSRAPFCSFLSIFMEAHSCRIGCGTPLKGFLSKEFSIWDLICGHWQNELYKFLLYLFKMLLNITVCSLCSSGIFYKEKKGMLQRNALQHN